MRYWFLVLTFCCFQSLCGDNVNQSRIKEMLPLPFHELHVEPAIPSEFMALSPEGSQGMIDWLYWGPEEEVKAYFTDNSKLKSGIIRVKLSANVAQTGPNSFSVEDELASIDPHAEIQKTHWGEYPVLSLKCQFLERKMYTAWVGLNDPGTGFALMFNLVYPEEQSEASEKDLALWENFILNTKGLPSAN